MLRTNNKRIRITTLVTTIVIALVGGVLFSISFIGPFNPMKDFCRELGVVLFTVSGVSMIYEIVVAEKHFEVFTELLKNQIERGESNASTCERLGIRQIYPHRDHFETEFRLHEKIKKVTAKSILRIVARTLFFVMTHHEVFRDALRNGAKVELCFYDPKANSDILLHLADYFVSDTEAALSTFRREFITWLQTEKPPGSLEIRYHKVHLLESFFLFSAPPESVIIWDFHFGRAISNKIIILLDPQKPLGENIYNRYNKIWDALSDGMFKYENSEITLNKLIS